MKPLSRKVIEVITSPLKFAFAHPFKTYIYFSAFIGTLAFISIYYCANFNKVMPSDWEVDLGNGFYYKTYALYDRSLGDKRIVSGAVRGLDVQGGYVIGKHTHDDINFFYFICEVGKDCKKTQNYTRESFEKTLKEKGISYTILKGHADLTAKEWFKRNFWDDHKLLSVIGCVWLGLTGCGK